MIKKALLIIASSLIFSHSAHAKMSLKIKGIDGELKDNVDAYLSSIPEKEYANTLRFRSRVEQSITEAVSYTHLTLPTTVDV